MRRWTPVWADQKADLVEQVRAVAADGSLDDLGTLHVDTAAAAELLAASMVRLGDIAARQVVEEAADQGVDIAAVPPRRADLEAVARVVTMLLGMELQISASRMAIRANGPLATPAEITSAVRDQLDSLSTASAETQFGGALHGAMNSARVATLKQAMTTATSVTNRAKPDPRPDEKGAGGRAKPEGALYASELNDKNTCKPCREINGRWLGNTSDMAQVEKLYPSGAYGGYIGCLGRERCRGTVVGVWRSKQVGDDGGPAAPKKPKPKPVPAKAKKWMRSIDGVEQVAATAQDAAKIPKDDERWRWLSGGASGAQTHLVVLDDGRRIVHKQMSEYTDNPKTQADAEHLGSLTARALGVPVAGVYRDQADAVWIEHVDGKHLDTQMRDEQQRYWEWLDSPAAVRMGLLDALIGNTDRHEGNVMFDGDRSVGIDHAFAYEMLGHTERGPVSPYDFGSTDEKPLWHYVNSGQWVANPLTSDDVAEVRRRLEALRPDYKKLGREAWLDKSLEVLDRLAEHATGTEPLYPPAALPGRQKKTTPAPQVTLTMRPALADAKTSAEVGAAFTAEIGRITGTRPKKTFVADFGEDVDTAREHAEGLLRGLERFPDAKIVEVGVFDISEHNGAYAYTAPMTAARGGRVLFSEGWTSNRGRQRYLDATRKDGQSGWRVKGTGTVAAIAVHEFGHLVDLGTLGGRAHDEIYDLVARRAAEAGISRSELVKRDISEYATSDERELVAEAFADVLINGDDASQLSKDIVDLLVAEHERSRA